MRAVVIGVGSPWGDDAIGLAVARALAAGPPLPARVLALERPGLDLLDALHGADVAVIVDALRAEGAPGRVRRLPRRALARAQRAPSTHGLGVAEALALGDALGVLPPRLEIVAVGIPPAPGPESALSLAVAAAVEPACRAVRALLAELGSLGEVRPVVRPSGVR